MPAYAFAATLIYAIFDIYAISAITMSPLAYYVDAAAARWKRDTKRVSGTPPPAEAGRRTFFSSHAADAATC